MVRHVRRWLAVLCVALPLVLAACSEGPVVNTPAAPTPRSGASTQDARQATPSTVPHTPSPAAPVSDPATGTPDTAGPTPAPAFATPPPSRLRRLTEPGCCTQPFWSYDSEKVLYIDRPSADQSTGLWGVDVRAPGAVPELVSQDLSIPSGGGSFSLARDSRGRAVIVRTSDGMQWTIDTGGGVPAISPDGRWVLWSRAGREVPYEQRSSTLYLMALDRPGPAQALVTVWGGGFAGWLADSAGVLVVGRPNLETQLRELTVVTVPSGQSRVLLQDELIANIQLSPDGRYVLCTVYFSGDPQRDGVWLLGTSGEEPRKMRFFGSYHWRDARHIVYVPLRERADDSHEFRQYEVLSRENIPLTDSSGPAFSIAGDDWSVSPDGNYITFVDSRDRAIWLLELSPQ